MHTKEATAAADILLERMAHLEGEVEKLTNLLEHGKGILTEAMHRTDEVYPVPSGNGHFLEHRLGNALHLAERLTAPENVEKFDQLLEAAEIIPDLHTTLKGIGEDIISQIPSQGLQLDERLKAITLLATRLTDPIRVDRINQLIDLLDGAPDVMEAITGVVRDLIEQVPGEGLRLDERFRAILPLLDQLTTPETATKLQQLLTLMETAPDLIQTVQGIAGDIIGQIPNEGLRFDERLQAMLPVIDKLTDPRIARKMNLLLTIVEQMPELELDPEDAYMKRAVQCEIELGRILHLLSATGSAFCQASKEPAKPMGLIGMFSAPFDRDRQIAIGFLMTFLKKFGQKL